MRVLIAAALAACLSGAAWAGEGNHGRNSCAESELYHTADIDTAEILRSVDAALREALAGLEGEDVSANTSAEIEAAISEAMAGLEADLATLDAHLAAAPEAQVALSEADEERIDERVEAAMERVEEALERIDERVEHRDDAEPKTWRPRY